MWVAAPPVVPHRLKFLRVAALMCVWETGALCTSAQPVCGPAIMSGSRLARTAAPAPVLIRPIDGLSVLGGDLHMTWLHATSPDRGDAGSRSTPTPGRDVPGSRLRSNGADPSAAARPGCRQVAPGGHLFVTLTPAPMLAPGPREDLLPVHKGSTPERWRLSSSMQYLAICSAWPPGARAMVRQSAASSMVTDPADRGGTSSPGWTGATWRCRFASRGTRATPPHPVRRS
jgi:hypothetical protein